MASTGYDRLIHIWDVFDPACKNLGFLKGHKNAVLDFCWAYDSSRIYSASADKNVCIWDTDELVKIRTLSGHTGTVNSIDVVKRGSEMLVTGSDDMSVKLWDPRTKTHIMNYQLNY